MNYYALADADGYATQFLSSVFEQEGMVLLDALPEQSPNSKYKFHIASKTWVDTRTEQEIQTETESLIKNARNTLLKTSDWTQFADVSLPNKADWATYRQALRDIPDQQCYPENVIWPIAPQ